MYPAPFRYHRASSLDDAITLLSQLGDDTRILAGGQSLIPLLKLRLDEPSDLVDIGRISGLNGIDFDDEEIRIGALATHGRISDSEVGIRFPIIRDCAAGIADVQVRSRGTIGGSLAEGDPSGDWAPVLITLGATVVCRGPEGSRSVPIEDFCTDAFETVLGAGEIVTEVRVTPPGPRSAGCYLAFKRSAQVYATASAAVHVWLEDSGVCREARISLGSAGLIATRLAEAEEALRGRDLTPQVVAAAAESAAAESQPESDMRGSSDYKRTLVRGLVRRAIEISKRRSAGESIEGSHDYV